MPGAWSTSCCTPSPPRPRRAHDRHGAERSGRSSGLLGWMPFPERSGGSGMTLTVTGTDQHRAWQQRVLPPVEQVRPGVFSIPVPIPDNPLRYTLSYAFLDDSGVLLVDPGWDAPQSRAALADGLRAAGATAEGVTCDGLAPLHPGHPRV